MKVSAKCSIYGGKKVYLGVRVKMPVKELLKNIRVAKGLPGEDLKVQPSDMKRVKTRFRCSNMKAQRTKSLEELAIIIEVLEEDLRTSSTCPSSPQDPHPPNSPVSPQLSPTGNSSRFFVFPAPPSVSALVFPLPAGYGYDEYDEIIPSPDYHSTCSPGAAEHRQAPSPPGFTYPAFQPPGAGGVATSPEVKEEWFDAQSSSAFFWTQLQREESQLSEVSDAALLTPDEHGRTALHKVAWVGKRALGYAIARRMAALYSLDLTDCDGMTALLYAAKHNHHLMVADLIHLGANVNQMNNAGKSCLHLSAENGYIRVLEVLKQAMMDGVYVDVEAADNAGMSVLQCAAVALKTTVSEMEGSTSPSHIRVHTLRQEQMMETLECLLQMGSFIHSARWASNQPAAQHCCPAGHFEDPTVMF
uniref:Zgc:113279 n=1 Tax=Salarias fasciatus TaxID=181472 RepID=A0A672I6G3_SALFA